MQGISLGSIQAVVAAADPKALFDELGSRFARNAKIIKHMVEVLRCRNLNELATLFDKEADVGPVLVDKLKDIEAAPMEINRVRQAWLGVKAAILKKESNTSRAELDADLGSLLAQTDLDALAANLFKRYKQSFPPDIDCADSGVLRFQKEIKRVQLRLPDML